MANLYKQFLDLQPPKPLEVGTVLFIDHGLANVEMPGGGAIQARGQATQGQRVFVRDGVIEGEAPTLTYTEGEV